jgi:hypothetical protein
MIKPNVSADFTVTGGIGVADAYHIYANPATLTVNFDNQLTETINAHQGDITLNGHQVDNDSTSYLTTSVAQINADVVGAGAWVMDLANLTLNEKVDAGQTFQFEGAPSNVTVDDPKTFNGVLDAATPDFGAVTLADPTATSYSYVNNKLTLYDGNKAIDHIRFADNSAFGVYKSGSSVVVSSNPQGKVIPLHTAVV